MKAVLKQIYMGSMASLLFTSIIVTVVAAKEYGDRQNFKRHVAAKALEHEYAQETRMMELSFAGSALQYTVEEIARMVERACAAFGDGEEVLERLERR